MANSVIVCDGDSITYGYGITQPYPSLLSLTGSWVVLNQGVPGATLAEMRTGASVGVDSHFNVGGQNVVVIWGGTNDFFAVGSTVASAYSTLQGYCADRRAAGWKVIIATMLSRSGNNPVGGETLDSDKNSYNSLIRTNWASFADGLADVASNSYVGADGAYSNTTYFQGDQTHPTQYAVTNIIAPIISTALSSYTALSTHGLTFMQSHAIESSGSSATITYPAITQGSSFLGLLVVSQGNSAVVSSVADSLSNVWNLVSTRTDNSTFSVPTTSSVYICNANTGAGGFNTVTVNFTEVTTLVALSISEWVGQAGAPLDVVSELLGISPARTVITSKLNTPQVIVTEDKVTTLGANTNYSNETAIAVGWGPLAGSLNAGSEYNPRYTSSTYKFNLEDSQIASHGVVGATFPSGGMFGLLGIKSLDSVPAVSPTTIFGTPALANNCNSGTTTSLSATANTAAGDLIVVAVFYQTGVTATVTDTIGNTYTPLIYSHGPMRGGQIFYCLSSSGANTSNSVTVTFSGLGSPQTYINVWDIPVSGGAVTLDTSASAGSSDFVNNYTSPTFNTTGFDELVFVNASGEGETTSISSLNVGYILDSGNVANSGYGGVGHQAFFAPQTGLHVAATYADGVYPNIQVAAFKGSI